jgi:hypothetical protein
MGSWSSGFVAGCSTALASVVLVSVLMLPSMDVVIDGVQSFGTNMISSALPFGDKGSNNATAPPSGHIDILKNAVQVDTPKDNGFDDFR